MPLKLTAIQIEVKPGSSWETVDSAHILEVSGSLEVSGDRAGGLASGESSDLHLTIKLADAALASVPEYMPIRATFTVNGASAMAFNGIVIKPSRTLKGRARTLACEGIRTIISTTRVYSPAFYRRRAATKTTVVEDPTDGAYAAGLINYALWQAGGRPAEQDFAYPDATFYYSIADDALFAPDWSWLAGEDAWEQCLLLARAVGGQIFQDGDGIVRYRQPLAFGSGTPTYTFTPSVYADISEETPTDRLITKVVCTHIPRTKQGVQEVVNDATIRIVEAGATITITLEPRYPLASLQYAQGSTTQLDPKAIVARFYEGSTVAQGGSGYTHTVTFAAQQIVIAVTNATARPFEIKQIVLSGEPIVPGEAAEVSAGSGTVVRTIEDNPFIQSRAHAEQLVAMTLAFHGTARPTRTLTGCPYDPDRVPGETVGLTCAPWSLSAAPHVITAIRHNKAARTSDYTLIDVSGLPTTSDFFFVGSTNYTGLSKQLSW